MPTPRPQESERDFISRCMRSAEARRTAPDQGQRYKLCQGLYRREKMQKFDLEVPITKTDEDKRLVYGFASVIEDEGGVVVDSQGDVITEDDLIKMAHDFMLESRTGGAMHMQKDGEPVKVADVVESIVLTKDVQQSLGIDLGKVGWFIGVKVHDDGVWNAVKSGKLRAFSIGGSGKREEIPNAA